MSKEVQGGLDGRFRRIAGALRQHCRRPLRRGRCRCGPAASILPVDRSGDNDEVAGALRRRRRAGWRPGTSLAGTVEMPARRLARSVVYNRLGQLARQVRDALRELGLDTTLHRAAEAVPTRASASPTSPAPPGRRPASAQRHRRGRADPDGTSRTGPMRCARWDEPTPDPPGPGLHELSADTRLPPARWATARAAPARAPVNHDGAGLPGPPGRVIKRLVELLHARGQLLRVLIEARAGSGTLEPEQAAGLLNGPVVIGPAEQRRGAGPGPGRQAARASRILAKPRGPGPAQTGVVPRGSHRNQEQTVSDFAGMEDLLQDFPRRRAGSLLYPTSTANSSNSGTARMTARPTSLWLPHHQGGAGFLRRPGW